MKQPKVAIIIQTCNQEELVKKCLSSLRNKTNYKNYKVYLVDDSGTDKIGKSIKRKFKWIDLTINKKNLGSINSFNKMVIKSIKEYSPDYILHLDDDTEIIEKDFLKKMIDIAESDERIGILGCKLIYPEGNLQYFFKDEKIHFIRAKEKAKDIEETEETFKTREVEDIIGACFLIKISVIDKIGLYDEKFSPIYGEETDFCYRARSKGFKMIYVGNTKVIHYNGFGSSKKILDSGGGKWFLQKRHAIRLEWLNFKVSKIIKFTFIHFGSAVFSKNPFKKLVLLLKAYKEDIKNFKEIKQKRKERCHW